MLHQLTALAKGHVVVFMEEEQLQTNLQSSIQTLLGNPLPSLTLPVEGNKIAANEAIQGAISAHKASWTSLAFDIKLPKKNVLVRPWVEDARHAKFNPEIEHFYT